MQRPVVEAMPLMKLPPVGLLVCYFRRLSKLLAQFLFFLIYDQLKGSKRIPNSNQNYVKSKWSVPI